MANDRTSDLGGAVPGSNVEAVADRTTSRGRAARRVVNVALLVALLIGALAWWNTVRGRTDPGDFDYAVNRLLGESYEATVFRQIDRARITALDYAPVMRDGPVLHVECRYSDDQWPTVSEWLRSIGQVIEFPDAAGELGRPAYVSHWTADGVNLPDYGTEVVVLSDKKRSASIILTHGLLAGAYIAPDRRTIVYWVERPRKGCEE